MRRKTSVVRHPSLLTRMWPWINHRLIPRKSPPSEEAPNPEKVLNTCQEKKKIQWKWVCHIQQHEIKTNLVVCIISYFLLLRLGKEKAAIMAHSRLAANLGQINGSLNLLLWSQKQLQSQYKKIPRREPNAATNHWFTASYISFFLLPSYPYSFLSSVKRHLLSIYYIACTDLVTVLEELKV